MSAAPVFYTASATNKAQRLVQTTAGRLAVLPTFRKQGVAHALVDAVENRARELHLPKVTLKVRIQLSGNRAFFERIGYQVVAYNAHDGYSEPTFMTLEKLL